MHNLKLILLLLLFVDIQVSLAQKHDYMWPLGLGPSNNEYRRFFYDFKTLDIVIRDDTMSNGVYTASYCDANGDILFYSNGLRILNGLGLPVENGAGLNPTVTAWQAYTNYPTGQSGFFLEKPEDPNIVYFISLDMGPHPAQKWPYMFTGQNLMVATIDITANNGAGKVLEKNRVLLTGVLMSPAACRHANGRDWWIMVSDSDENRHYRIMLSPEGFSEPETQHIGTKPNPIPYEGGNKSNQTVGNCFSPSGNYYVDINAALGFSVYRFDRCSGLLSNEKRVDYFPEPNNPIYYRSKPGAGVVFSADENFFYNTVKKLAHVTFSPDTKPYLLQYDLSAPDFAASGDTINVIDPLNHWPYSISQDGFYGAELGPDGRIYIVHSGLGYCTVQYPNLKGKACKLVHDKPFFDVVIGSAIPYMPNYRLGPLDGSPCDTLGLDNIPVANFRVDDTLGLLSRYFYDLSHHEPAAWHWDFGDGNSSSVQSPLHEYDSAGVYQVCLTVSNPYGSDTHCRTLYLGVSATGAPVRHSSILLYPNPAKDWIEARLDHPAKANSQLRLYDLAGRLLKTEPISAGALAHRVPLSGLPNGWYLVCLLEGGRVVAREKMAVAR